MTFKDGSRIRGGKSYRQNQTFKEFIRRRDNFTCQLCGDEGWIVDHIVPYTISHETRPDGVRVLCHACNLKTRQKRESKRLPLAQWGEYLKSELAEGGIG